MLQEQGQSQRFWLVLIIILSLGCIYFFVIPFLSSQGVGGGGNTNSNVWIEIQQRQLAFNLAQNVQITKLQINQILQQDVSQVLEQQFGLSAKEQRQYIGQVPHS